MERVIFALLYGKSELFVNCLDLNWFSPSIWIGHNAEGCEGRDAEYMSFRRPEGGEFNKLTADIDLLWYQRNYLKCVVDI